MTVPVGNRSNHRIPEQHVLVGNSSRPCPQNVPVGHNTRPMHHHVPVGQPSRNEHVPVGQPSRNEHVPVGQHFRNPPLNHPQLNRPVRNVAPPTRVQAFRKDDVQSIPIPTTNFDTSSSFPSHPVRSSRNHSISWINKIGYIPGIGTIIGIFRIAISTLRLTYCKSPVDRFQLHQEIKRGFIELIPFLGGGILYYKDRH